MGLQSKQPRTKKLSFVATVGVAHCGNIKFSTCLVRMVMDSSCINFKIKLSSLEEKLECLGKKSPHVLESKY